MSAKASSAYVHPSPIKHVLINRVEIKLIVREGFKGFSMISDEFHEPVFALLVEFPVHLDLVEDVVLLILDLANEGFLTSFTNPGFIWVGIEGVDLLWEIADEGLVEGLLSLESLTNEEKTQLKVVCILVFNSRFQLPARFVWVFGIESLRRELPDVPVGMTTLTVKFLGRHMIWGDQQLIRNFEKDISLILRLNKASLCVYLSHLLLFLIKVEGTC